MSFLFMVSIAILTSPSAKAGSPPVTTIISIDLKKQTIAIRDPKHELPTVYLLSPATTVEIHGQGASIVQLSTGMLVRSIRLGSSVEPPQVLEDIDIP